MTARPSLPDGLPRRGARPASRATRFFELVVAPHSMMVGRRIGDLRLDRDHGVRCIAVQRSGRHLRERASQLALRPGDPLLVLGEEASEARRRASTDFVLLLGTLALGEAMQETGLAASCARWAVDALEGHGPAAVASGLLLVGALLNPFTSPDAVAALLTPIALATAGELGLAGSRAFPLAIAFAGSNAFATPMGHQVNLMVMGPGGSRAADSLRLGLPICGSYWLFVSDRIGLDAVMRAGSKRGPGPRRVRGPGPEELSVGPTAAAGRSERPSRSRAAGDRR